MTDPYARPAQPEDADATIPLMPDSGYSQPQQSPFADETLIDPLPAPPSYQPPVFPTGESNYHQPDLGYQPYPTTSSWSDPVPAAAPAPIAPAQPSAPPAYYPSGMVLADHPNSTTALVLGILGIIGLWPLGPLAWYLGAKGKREMREQPGRWGSSGGLTAGLVLGIITTALIALVGLAVMFFVLVVVIASR